MKFSIVAIALFAAIIGHASPIPDTPEAADPVPVAEDARQETPETLSTSSNTVPDAPLVVVRRCLYSALQYRSKSFLSYSSPRPCATPSNDKVLPVLQVSGWAVSLESPTTRF